MNIDPAHLNHDTVITYRPAIPDDLQNLRTLGISSYGVLKTHMSLENWEKMQTQILSEDTFPSLLKNAFGFVAEEDGKLLGMAWLVSSGNPTKIYSAKTSYIRMVGVDPNATGKGIAQRLTQLCMEKAKETKEFKISLHSAEIMYAARHVYEKCGFKKLRLLDAHYGLAYWLYECDLTI